MPHKDYLRFVSESSFGVVGSITAPLHFVKLNNQIGRYIATPTCENVTIWDLKLREKILVLSGGHHAVTAMAYKEDGRLLAVGYQNGFIRVFSLDTGAVQVTFAGHRTGVSCMAFDAKSDTLATGGQDCSVQLWDILGGEGLFKLLGHKNVVTQCRFLTKHPNILITSSKDMLIKFWNLDIQHCFKTIMSTNQEVVDFVLLRDDTLMISSPADGDPIAWHLKPQEEEELYESPMSNVFKDDFETAEDLMVTNDDSIKIPLEVEKIGHIKIGAKVQALAVDPSQTTLCILTSESKLILSRLASTKELSKRQKRKKQAVSSADMFVNFNLLQAMDPRPRKIKCVDILIHNGSLLVGATLADNTLGFYTCKASSGPEPKDHMEPVIKAGHRRFPLAISYCSAIDGLISVSGESLRHWYLSSHGCPRSQPLSKVALCMVLVPGESHIIIGTKDGSLYVHDAVSLQEVSVVEGAHSSAIKSLCLHSDQKTLVSAGTDKRVMFWTLKYKKNKSQLTLVNNGDQPVQDEALCIKCSHPGTDPKKQVLAVALFNCHVVLFHLDTMKFSLQLTGHSQPVQCMDISDDNQIIATGGGDKMIKIWGLAYGQCLRSILAHDNMVSCIKFNPGSHMFFSGSMDMTIKHWDGDTYEKITTLRGHQSEVMDLATFPSGATLASCSRDFSIRTWAESDEVVLVEEEREKDLDDKIMEENLYEENLPKVTRAEEEAVAAGIVTAETLDLADRIMEYLELYKTETEALAEYKAECRKVGKQLPPPPVNVKFQAFKATTPLQFMSAVLSRNTISTMDQALQKLPFTYAHRFLQVLKQLLKKRWNERKASHYHMLLLRQHENQLKFGETFTSPLDASPQHLDNLREEGALLHYGTSYNVEAIKSDQDNIDFAKTMLERTH